MRIDHPQSRHLTALRSLWKTAFGDTDAFLDCFFGCAFSPDRCRCILEGDTPAAALYWLDCRLGDRAWAYIYAVATDPAFRGRGLCRQLMADTHALLKSRGYAGAVLVPQQEGLRSMYAAFGYRDFGGMDTVSAVAARPCPLEAIGPGKFALRRAALLPPGGLTQEGVSLDFLARQLQFYAGDGFTLAAWQEKGILQGTELLGHADPAALTAALGCASGRFRIPGSDPFAMYLAFSPEAPLPSYLGFAFD